MKRIFVLLASAALLAFASLAAQAEEDCPNKACQDQRNHTGSKPGTPTEQLVCLDYPPIPPGSHVWLQLRKITGPGTKIAVGPFERPRHKIAKGQTLTQFCYGKQYHEEADEVYLCTEFPDGMQWFSARQRKAFGGSGAYERALARAPAKTHLTMCLGPKCPAKLP